VRDFIPVGQICRAPNFFVVAQAQTGTIRIIATINGSSTKYFPDVPTVAFHASRGRRKSAISGAENECHCHATTLRPTRDTSYILQFSSRSY
jgi:hypothetical protein